MYANKLAAAVKVDGQVLREDREVVTLPFGSEYSLLIKNLNSVRVQIKVSVDGTDATEGTWLIVQPNSSLELERFIRNGNLNRGNRLKFVERTTAVEKHRGVGAEDGLIRIEYKTEKAAPKVEHVDRHYHDYYHDHWYPWVYPYRPWGEYPYATLGGAFSNLNGGTGDLYKESSLQCSSGMQGGQNQQILRAQNMCWAANDSGITVAGSESNQQFREAAGFTTHEQTDVLVLKLRGEIGGKKVGKAVTVKTKAGCPTCGKKSKAKFCPSCGTALQMI